MVYRSEGRELRRENIALAVFALLVLGAPIAVHVSQML